MFSIKNLKADHYFLGFYIARDDRTLTVTQTRYPLSLLHKYGLGGAKLICINMEPLEPHFFLF
jgi:hypothetical protein